MSPVSSDISWPDTLQDACVGCPAHPAPQWPTLMLAPQRLRLKVWTVWQQDFQDGQRWGTGELTLY